MNTDPHGHHAKQCLGGAFRLQRIRELVVQELDNKEVLAVGIGASLFLVAVGAILAFAVTDSFNGVDLVAVGWILMIVGALGTLLSLIFWSSWGGLSRSHTTIVERDREVP